MKVLVVGGGGREHAIVWKLAQSPKVSKIFCAPGNGGIEELAQCVPIDVMDIHAMVRFALENTIELTIVAPDNPLAAGMVDAFIEKGLNAFGPVKAAAMIESSKIYAKDLMKKYRIPSAEYQVFDDVGQALSYLDQAEYPIVVKADGLALGKGVIIAQDKKEASDAVRQMMVDKIFKEAGERIVIEEYLSGPELSILAFTDGKTIIPMTSAQDYKRAYDGNRGANTGGMGSFSPSPIYDDRLAAWVEEHILRPTIEALTREGRAFKGVLYFGLMLTQAGPKVLEYNARFGDPETQVILPRLKTDLVDIIQAILDERLDQITIEWEKNTAVCVIMASGGYPGKYETGYEILGLEKLKVQKEYLTFHAGTINSNGRMFSAGGRVLGITAFGNDLRDASRKVYNGVNEIYFQDMHYRKDIGLG